MLSSLWAYIDCPVSVEIKQGKRKVDLSVNLPVVDPSTLPKLAVSDISSTKQRFIFDGLILNIYGTYDTNREWRFLRTDLTDKVGFDTVTLVAGSNYYGAHLSKIVVGSCIRIEGAIVVPRTANDGGSIDFSLQVDATTSITPIPAFTTDLFFVPELPIKSVIAKAAKIPNFKSTIAFVIVQVDAMRKNEVSMHEQLTIADGHSATDRATVCSLV